MNTDSTATIDPLQEDPLHWDVIVVGARCAGATLASLLARAGRRVLLLEGSRRGTDLTLSTHYMQPAGMAVLDRLGIGDRVRAVAPATKRFRAALDDSEFSVPLREGNYGYCVRRSTLDPWLQEAAESSGADFRDCHKVIELVYDAGRVTGVIASTPHGRTQFTADLVVGADGPHSIVARLTGVEEYLAEEGSRGGYWAYFDAPATWRETWDGTLEHRGDEARYVFRSDGGQLILVSVTSRERARSWGTNHRAEFMQHLAGSEATRAYSANKEPIGKLRGLLKMRSFYRRPVGPGFALCGDAGHFKDFVTGQGMSDALLDAERLARAILDGREEAFEVYWRARDVATLPLHFDAARQGRIGYNTAFTRWTFRCIANSPEIMARFPQVMERTLTPGEMVRGRELARFMIAALLRGRFNVLPGFFATGKALGVEQKEMARRQALLKAAQGKLDCAKRNAGRDAPESGNVTLGQARVLGATDIACASPS